MTVWVFECNSTYDLGLKYRRTATEIYTNTHRDTYTHKSSLSGRAGYRGAALTVKPDPDINY